MWGFLPLALVGASPPVGHERTWMKACFSSRQTPVPGMTANRTSKAEILRSRSTLETYFDMGDANVVKAAEFQTIGIAILLLSVPTQSPMAASLCVNQGGTDGCFRSIGSAVSAASPGDTIQVARGMYKEYVVVPKSISLKGESQDNTIIDAFDKPFGINIDARTLLARGQLLSIRRVNECDGRP
jgi:pectin methylesterase-like acyl-CoA thioesterase